MDTKHVTIVCSYPLLLPHLGHLCLLVAVFVPLHTCIFSLFGICPHVLLQIPTVPLSAALVAWMATETDVVRPYIWYTPFQELTL